MNENDLEVEMASVGMSLAATLRRINARLDALEQGIVGTGDYMKAQISTGQLTIDHVRQRVTWRGRRVDNLSITQFAIVCYLSRNVGAVRSREQIMDACDMSLESTDRAVDTQIKHVRNCFRAVDPEFNQIVPVYRAGYKWAERDRRLSDGKHG